VEEVQAAAVCADAAAAIRQQKTHAAAVGILALMTLLDPTQTGGVASKRQYIRELDARRRRSRQVP
jgi:hypothetical protein